MNDAIFLPISKQHLEKFLKPISRLTESCILKCSNSQISSICSSEDRSIILTCKMDIPFTVENDIRLNIIDIKSFLNGLNSFGEGEFHLEIYSNYILCRNVTPDNEKYHFKYFLVDNSVIKECPIKTEKISTLKFDTTFEISSEKIKKVVSASSFTVETTKVYISMDENGFINAELNDKTLQNVNTMSIPLTDKIDGNPLQDTFITTVDLFKNLITSKNNVKFRLNNEYKVSILEIEEDSVVLKYIVSSIIK
jgi:hypothetical protein